MDKQIESIVNIQDINVNNYQDGNQAKLMEFDERKPVENPNQSPFKYIGRIVAYFNVQGQQNSYSYGTATLIGQNIVLTSAHIIYSNQFNKNAVKVIFYPFFQQRKQGQALVGIQAQNFKIHPLYLNRQQKKWNNYDLAIIRLKKNSLIPQKNYININWDYFPLNELKFPIMIAGFSQSQRISGFANDYQLLYSISAPLTHRQVFLYYRHTTDAGNAGSPILYKRKNEQQYSIIGIHKGTMHNCNFGILICNQTKETLMQLVQLNKLQKELQIFYSPSRRFTNSQNQFLKKEIKKLIIATRQAYKKNEYLNKQKIQICKQNQNFKIKTFQYQKQINYLKRKNSELQKQINSLKKQKIDPILGLNKYSQKNEDIMKNVKQQKQNINSIIFNSSLYSNKITNHYRNFFYLTKKFCQQLQFIIFKKIQQDRITPIINKSLQKNTSKPKNQVKQLVKIYDSQENIVTPFSNQFELSKVKQIFQRYKFQAKILQKSYEISEFYLNQNLQNFFKQYVHKLLRSFQPSSIQQIEFINQKKHDISPKLIERIIYSPKYQQLKINDIQILKLKNYQNLLQLDLSSNKLRNLPKKSLSNKIQYLKLNNNLIETVQQLFQSQFSKLKYVNISQNKLKILPAINSKQLQFLDAGYNQIQIVSKFTDRNYPGLKNLYLMNNKIATIPTFNTPNLEQLDLKNNEIKDIDGFIKSKLKTDIEIYLTCYSQASYKRFEQIISKLKFKPRFYLNLKYNDIDRQAYLKKV